MRKIFFAIVFIVITQAVDAQKLLWGLRAGANITNFSGGDVQNIKKKALVGYHAGIFLAFKLGPLYLQPEVLVSTAGAKYENRDSSFKLIYLSVPVMLKYRTLTGIYFELGPQVGFKLSENVSNQTVGNFAKNLDLAAAGGIGFQTKKGLGVGGRYLVGLSTVGDFQASPTRNPDFKNSIIQFSITIPLNK